MALQNFVDKVGPVVSAAWLNAVDRLKFSIFADAATKAEARVALTSDDPLEITNGGTGARTPADARTNLGLSSTGGYPQTPEELALGITPTEILYEPGNILRYGAERNPLAANASDTNNAAFIAAIAVAGATGGNVHIPPNSNDAGTTYWVVSQEFTLGKRVTVYGHGMSSQINQVTTEKNLFILGDFTTVRDVYLKGAGGLTPADYNKNNGVYGNGKKGLRVENIFASHWPCAGIQLRDCNDYNLIGNTLFQNTVVTNLSASQSDILIYSMTSGSRGVISHNHCYSNMRAAGIFVDAIGYDFNLVISDNVVVTLDANWAEESTANVTRRHGILVSYQNTVAITSPGGRIICSNNVIGNCMMTGIYRACANDPTYPVIISGNFISKIGWGTAEPSLCGGIYLNNGGAGDLIQGNTIIDFQGVGGSGAGGCIVVNTLSTTNAGHVTVEGNRCLVSTTHAINLSGDVRNVLVQRNSITDIILHDIYVIHTASHPNSTGGHIIRDNWILRNGGLMSGIFLYLQDAAAPTYVVGNWIQGTDNMSPNGVDNNGIYLHQGTGTAYVWRNIIGNFYYGVRIAGLVAGARVSLPSISDNQITSCAYGIYAIGTDSYCNLGVRGNVFRSLIGSNVQGAARALNTVEGSAWVTADSSSPAGEVPARQWQIGDRVVNTSPSAGGSQGWICTVSGIPGTWKEYGSISA